MPEGPELCLAAKYVNQVCSNRVFTGKVVKSAVSLKNPDVPWDQESYTISAISRGKEVKLTLCGTCGEQKEKKKKKLNASLMDIIFRFGMSGKFKFQSVGDYKVEKHAHLNFISNDDMVLSFVDYRRFGRWEVTSDWGVARGPCVLTEPHQFRKRVLDNLEASVFKKPICEVLLDQKYFNGIGNYLRAEILYRLGIPPFSQARSVLEPLKGCEEVKREEPDILDLCHQLPNEVITLSGGKGYSPEDKEGSETFWEWLRCYYKPGMKNMVDHNSRTIWFDGEPGSMVPKERKTRGRKTVPASEKKTNSRKKKAADTEGEEKPTKKKNMNTRNSLEKRRTNEKAEESMKSRKSSRRNGITKPEESMNTRGSLEKKKTKNIKTKV